MGLLFLFQLLPRYLLHSSFLGLLVQPRKGSACSPTVLFELVLSEATLPKLLLLVLGLEGLAQLVPPPQVSSQGFPYVLGRSEVFLGEGVEEPIEFVHLWGEAELLGGR